MEHEIQVKDLAKTIILLISSDIHLDFIRLTILLQLSL